ncbi:MULTISPECIES: 4Fe-4S binding protein [Pseudomonadati]|uniref:4Fe-4S binding protein n=1 Tax=Shewanella aestuarii TaxID=1028752 RepID=A0ABT0L468_9GAMM|nr:4Fe-4S binding protein [Shewanella aestuarii]MCL1118528.1 4Fe-4S binding protein [Shewanella aestuarii]GGN82954.1 4Fe-4S ferredoxin [Shewanella aestuarii]
MSMRQSQSELKNARQQVMASTQILQNLIPPTVSYTTQGHVLIIGPEDLARLAADGLSTMASRVVLANESITSQDEAHLEKVMNAAQGVDSFYNKLKSIKGFLGQFQVSVESDAGGVAELSVVAIRQAHFDIILDLSSAPCINLEMLPAGYFYVGQDASKLADAIEQIPDLVGEFDKPRYVKVNSDICAHHRNGINGCNRCLNFCPADAISSIEQKIEIDPYLCHGAGSCTNLCPTGAISYDLPTPKSLHSYLEKLISRYRAEAQVAPVILFHDNILGSELITDTLSGDVLPIAMEEITVASIDHWLAALAHGAREVLILNTDATAPTLTQMLQGELTLANRILDEMGQPQRLRLISATDLATLEQPLAISTTWPVIVPMTLNTNAEASNAKRDILYQAIDHLNSQAGAIQTQLTLPNVPYGQVKLNVDKCTLCMSCVSTCPTQALKDGGESPALRFVEQDCVQCGLCESSCPENVISLVPQINFDQQSRQGVTTLKEEAPFECIRCGSAFATQSMVHKMVEMVGAHSAFSANIERLKMCGDCRVKDMFEDILQDPEKQLR